MIKKFMYNAMLSLFSGVFLSNLCSAEGLQTGDVANFTSIDGSYSVEVFESRGSGVYGIRQDWQNERPALTSWITVEAIEQALIAFSTEHAVLYFDRCVELGGMREQLEYPGKFLPVCTYSLDNNGESYSVSPNVPLGIAKKIERSLKTGKLIDWRILLP